MKILLTGATGFIGARLAAALRERGHTVVGAARRGATIEVDFTRDHAPADWLPHLAGIDAVVNAVGIFREHGTQRFDALHRAAPVALFQACARLGTARVVQVSALGADAQAHSAYHRSKRAADTALAALELDAAIAQPSLVYGQGGTSAALFGTMASLPVLPLPGRGAQRVQPIHVDDAVAALVALVEARTGPGCTVVPLVGPEPVTFARWLAALRAGLGLRPTLQLPMPIELVRAVAGLAARWPGAPLDPDAIDMLERGNVGDPAPTAALLGHPARPVERFIAPEDAPGEQVLARLGWLVPLLRSSLAAVWLTAALVSMGAWPVQDSYAMLARIGVPEALRPLALWGAAGMDLAFAVATLWPRAGRRLWLAQMALVAVYSLLIAWRLPEFWLHPFGPMVKNLPILAVLAVLVALAPPARR